MRVNDLLQRTILDALASDYTVDEIRQNVEIAIERHEQYIEDDDALSVVVEAQLRARLAYVERMHKMAITDADKRRFETEASELLTKLGDIP